MDLSYQLNVFGEIRKSIKKNKISDYGEGGLSDDVERTL